MNKEFVPYTESLQMKELGFEEVVCAYYFIGNPYSHGSPENPAFYMFPICGDEGYEEPELINQNKYPAHVSAPLWQQAFRWFRDEHKLLGELYHADSSEFIYCIETFNNDGKDSRIAQDGNFPYEEAQLACLRELIKIVKDEQTRRA